MAEFFIPAMAILLNHFYFIKNDYYEFANDPFLMENKENGAGRPCFLAIKETNDIIWMVPVSSKFDKFRRVYEKKIDKFGYCDTIILSTLLGRPCAFLIQNAFPITEKYIEHLYVQKSNDTPVSISSVLSFDITKKLKKALALKKAGKDGLIFTDVFRIEKELLSEKNPDNKEDSTKN